MLRHQYELAKHRDYRWRFSAQDSTCTTARLAVVVDTLCLSGQSERALELLDHLQSANLSQRELWTASLLYHHRRCRLLMICGRTEEARADAEQVSEALRLHGSRVSAIYRGTVQQVTAEQRLFSAAMEQNWSLVYQCATENRATAPTKEAKLWALLGIYYSAQHLDDAEIDTDAIMEQIRLLIPRYCDTAVQWNDRHRE